MNRWKQAIVSRTGASRVSAAMGLIIVMVLVAAACGDDSVDVTTTAAAGTPVARGQQLAGESCSSCHGQNFEGVKNLGPALTDNDFIREHTDGEVSDLIKDGRSRDALDNKTGLAMPPYGGNPRLSDDDVADIVLFLRTLQ